MRTHAVVLVAALGAASILSCAGCGQAADAEATKRIAALDAKVAGLETKVADLEKRNNDLKVKGRIVASSLFGSPLENFFASDEFWENTYDSGQADCAKRCAATLQTELAACQKITDCAQRQQCIKDAVERASNCQTQCSKSHPPVP
ncbi:MAG: hypothetical protein U0575_00535 [Phycisphaerales bacterium]|jgi:hypothetical protein